MRSAWRVKLARLKSIRHTSPTWGLWVVLAWQHLSNLNTGFGLPSLATSIGDLITTPWGNVAIIFAGFAWLGFLILRPERQPPITLDSIVERIVALEARMTPVAEYVEMEIGANPFLRTNIVALTADVTEIQVHIEFESNIIETISSVVMEVSGQELEAVEWEPCTTADERGNIRRVARFPRPGWLVPGAYSIKVITLSRQGTMKWGIHRQHEVTIP